MTKKHKDVETSIRHKLEFLPKSPFNHCIYKVPKHILEIKKECYYPSAISIGPMHSRRESLKRLEELKLMHLQCFLEYGHKDYSLGHYINIMKSWKEEVRSYYTEEISLSSNEFVEMLLIDAAFIIYLFMCTSDRISLEKYPIIDKPEVVLLIQQDLFTEENQLPFFILENLYDIAFGKTFPFVTFRNLTCTFISKYYSVPSRYIAGTTRGVHKVSEVSNIKHLIDFLRILSLPSKPRNQGMSKINGKVELPLSAKELKAAGVKFIATESTNLLDVTFSNGVLRIPRLEIHDKTEAIFRNIMFFEQCHYYNDSYVNDYVIFLDGLIDTVEDVKILVDCGIIDYWLGNDEEVATLFNRLDKNIMFNYPNFYYAGICKGLNEFASFRWNKLKAALRREYFSHPWSSISVIYAVIILILTVLQVVYCA